MSSLAADLAGAGVDLPGSGVGPDWAGTRAGADLAGAEVAGPRTGVTALSASLFFCLASLESDLLLAGARVTLADVALAAGTDAVIGGDMVTGAVDETGVVVCAGLVKLKIGDRRQAGLPGNHLISDEKRKDIEGRPATATGTDR